MVGDALAVWDVCSRHAELLRLPPFPFARLAAALCPDRKSTERITTGGAGGTGTPASAATPLASGFPSATPSLTPSLGLTTPASAVGIPTAFSDAVGAESLAAQPGDPELASECLLRDVHCAFLRVIENADVGDHVGAPTRSTAEGGGGALPVGWPERAREADRVPAGGVGQDAAFGAARSPQRWNFLGPARATPGAALVPGAPSPPTRRRSARAPRAPRTRARGRRRRAARRRHDRRAVLEAGRRGGNRRGVRREAGIRGGRALRAAAGGGGGLRLDSAETEATPTPTKAAAAEPAGGRTSSRRRAKPVKFEDTSVPAPAAAGAGANVLHLAVGTRGGSQVVLVPGVFLPGARGVAARLRGRRRSRSGGGAAGAAGRAAGGAGGASRGYARRGWRGRRRRDDGRRPSGELFGEGKRKRQDDTDDAVRVAVGPGGCHRRRRRRAGNAQARRSHGARRVRRARPASDPRRLTGRPEALVALRASLTQTLSFFPFWEGADFAKRLAAAVARARARRRRSPTPRRRFPRRSASSTTPACWWWAGGRRAAWRAAVDAARTLPQLALCAHELAEHRARDKGRVKMLREAFQRVGRGLATSGPPEQRLAAAPFLPQTREKVVLSALALRRATNALASHLESSFQDKSSGGDKDTLKSGEDVSETRARALGLPRVPPDLPALTQCRVEFAGYRKGDPAAPAPAARVPHAWYLLTPLQAMAPEAAKVAGAEPDGARRASPMGALAEPRSSPSGRRRAPIPPRLCPRRRWWWRSTCSRAWPATSCFPSSRPRRSCAARGARATACAAPSWTCGRRCGAARPSGAGPRSASAMRARVGGQAGPPRRRPVGDVVGGVVVKADWWRNAPDPSRAGPVEGAVGVTVRNARKRARVRSPWTCEPLGAVCVRWDAPPPPSAERQAGEPATAADGRGVQSEEVRRRAAGFRPGTSSPTRRRSASALASSRWRRRSSSATGGSRTTAGSASARTASAASAAWSRSATKTTRRLQFPKSSPPGVHARAPRAVALPRARVRGRCRRSHEHHPCGPGRPLKVPTFCHVELDLHRVFAEVQARGGFRAVTDAKRWREVCRSLGHDLSGQTSASFAMRQNYERCLLDYEAHLYEEERRGESSETRAKANSGLSSGKRKNEGALAAVTGTGSGHLPISGRPQTSHSPYEGEESQRRLKPRAPLKDDRP